MKADLSYIETTEYQCLDLLAKSVRYISCGKLKRASELIQRAIQQAPTQNEQLGQIIAECRKLGVIAQARKNLKKAGELLVGGEPEAALIKYEYISVAGIPRELSFQALHNKATALTTLGSFEEALGCFQEASLRKPAHSRTSMHIAYLFMTLGKYSTALRYFEDIIRADKIEPADLLHVLYGSAVCRQQLSPSGDHERSAEKALEAIERYHDRHGKEEEWRSTTPIMVLPVNSTTHWAYSASQAAPMDPQPATPVRCDPVQLVNYVPFHSLRYTGKATAPPPAEAPPTKDVRIELTVLAPTLSADPAEHVVGSPVGAAVVTRAKRDALLRMVSDYDTVSLSVGASDSSMVRAAEPTLPHRKQKDLPSATLVVPLQNPQHGHISNSVAASDTVKPPDAHHPAPAPASEPMTSNATPAPAMQVPSAAPAYKPRLRKSSLAVELPVGETVQVGEPPVTLHSHAPTLVPTNRPQVSTAAEVRSRDGTPPPVQPLVLAESRQSVARPAPAPPLPQPQAPPPARAVQFPPAQSNMKSNASKYHPDAILSQRGAPVSASVALNGPPAREHIENSSRGTSAFPATAPMLPDKPLEFPPPSAAASVTGSHRLPPQEPHSAAESSDGTRSSVIAPPGHSIVQRPAAPTEQLFSTADSTITSDSSIESARYEYAYNFSEDRSSAGSGSRRVAFPARSRAYIPVTQEPTWEQLEVKRALASRRHVDRFTITSDDLEKSNPNANVQSANPTAHYPYAALKSPGPFPPGVDVCSRELYLSDAEFQAVMRCDKATWAAMPVWRQRTVKQSLGLF